MIGIVTDISDIREKRDSLQKAAQLDDFTGLYKKGYAIARMEKILQQELGQSHALVILDIDNFKAFDDTYGHDIGDKIIWEAASRFKAAFRKTDILGRFGGDGFILFVRDIDGIQWLQSKLRNCFAWNWKA